ncbi:MAG: hypothetical protein R6X20_06880 [Phycisphaerae bacterium]
MPRSWHTPCALCLAIAAAAAPALGMGADHPNDRPVSHEEWPDGLAEIINTKARVCGFFINASDWFYFKGDTKAFNAVLAAYAKLKDTPLRLVLHPGRCLGKAPWDKGKGTPCEWSIAVTRRGWGAPKAKPGETGNYVVTVNLWLGGDVALDGLDVPLNVDVASGREIETFVVHHQAKQSLDRPQREAGPRDSVEPATEGRRECGKR